MDDHEVEESAPQDQPDEGSSGQQNEPKDDAQDESTKSSPDTPEAQVGKEGNALSWLEGPAFDSPVEEMPTLRWPEDRQADDTDDVHEQATSTNMNVDDETHEDNSEPIDDLDEAMTWLEQLADGQGTPIDEMPTLISKKSSEDMDVPSPPIDAEEGSQGSSAAVPTDSDPMAWLEQLAVDQNSPLEELPSVANRLLASDIASQASNGADSRWQSAVVDEALTYLESIALKEGVSLTDVTIDDVETDSSIEEKLIIIDQLAGAGAATTTGAAAVVETADEDWDDLSEQMPDDPDEALAWLSEFSEEDMEEVPLNGEISEDIPIVENEESEGERDQPQAHSEAAVDEQFLEEMPDDPDEAMVWMKGLADQQDDLKDSVESPEKPQETDATSAAEMVKPEGMNKAREDYLSGNQDEAVEHYRGLIKKGEGGPELIEDLESMVAEKPEDPQLHQLLGDAYMKEGHIQKALKAYQQQLAQS